MFQFRRFPSYSYFIHCRIPFGGFPHSEISGSKFICNSPKLIAAYHVLHRLLMPRHSPCALISLTSSESASAPLRFRPRLSPWPKTSLRSAAPPLESKPACAGLLIRLGVRLCVSRFRCFQTIVNSYRQSIWFSMTVELCRLIKKFSLAKNCILPFLIKKVFLYCCLLIILHHN